MSEKIKGKGCHIEQFQSLTLLLYDSTKDESPPVTK